MRRCLQKNSRTAPKLKGSRHRRSAVAAATIVVSSTFSPFYNRGNTAVLLSVQITLLAKKKPLRHTFQRKYKSEIRRPENRRWNTSDYEETGLFPRPL